MAGTAGESTRPMFSVIIPTRGRKTLRDTLRRLEREDDGDIEVIVVSDGPQPIARAIVNEEAARGATVRFYEGPLTQNWGNAQRTVGIDRAAGRYLMFIDDDDKTRRGAFRAIREVVRRQPDRIILFRMKWLGQILWHVPELAEENVGTPMVVVPNVPGKIGSWLTRDRYESDFDFITECVELQGDPVWSRDIIVIADPFCWSEPIRWLERRTRRRRRSLPLGARRLVRRNAR